MWNVEQGHSEAGVHDEGKTNSSWLFQEGPVLPGSRFHSGGQSSEGQIGTPAEMPKWDSASNKQEFGVLIKGLSNKNRSYYKTVSSSQTTSSTCVCQGLRWWVIWATRRRCLIRNGDSSKVWHIYCVVQCRGIGSAKENQIKESSWCVQRLLGGVFFSSANFIKKMGHFGPV